MNEIPSGAQAAPAITSRMRYIDSLRAIAALLVLWLHVSESFHRISPATEAKSRWLYELGSSVDLGRIGVVVFFLISGFVIPFSLRADGASPIVPFAIKRFFRIFPAYWLSVPLGALTAYWIWGGEFGVRDFLVNLTLLQDLFGIKSAEGLYWTLLVEIVFYASCIVLFVTGSLFAIRKVGFVVAALTLIFSAMMLMHWLRWPGASSVAAFWFLNIAVMLWGTMYRSWTSTDGRDRDPLATFLLWGLLAYFLIVLPVGTSLAIGVHNNVTLSYAIGFLIFLAGTRALRIETRLTDWLGTISYSIYLFHPIVFLSIKWWLLRQPEDAWLRTRPLGVYLAVVVVLTVLVASLVYRFVERPGIRLGHRFAAAWQRRRDTGSRQCPAPAPTLPNGGRASQTTGIITTKSAA